MYADQAVDWAAIKGPALSLLVEERRFPISESNVWALLQNAPFCSRAEGTLEEVLLTLVELPDDLLNDVSMLGSRFIELMCTDHLRVRIEGVTSNACKKLHSDYTDLRLITTYVGPGTDYSPNGDPQADNNSGLERLPTGAIGLFKGKLFGKGHRPCLHRSPPIEGTDQVRLVLVIDTPEPEEF